MNLGQPFLNPDETTTTAWARRRETINATVKLFRVVLDAMQRHAQWVESKHGIDAVSLCLLWELAQAPGLRAVDLARNLATTRATVESMLDELERREFVVRSPNPNGVVLYACSDAGRWLAESAPDYAQGALKTAMAPLPDSLLDDLAQDLSHLVVHLPFRNERAALQPGAELIRPLEPGSRGRFKKRQ